MPTIFPNSTRQSVEKMLNKSLLGFIPATALQHLISMAIPMLDTDKWNRGNLAFLSVFFNRVLEGNAKNAYAEAERDVFYLAQKSGCTLEDAKNFASNNIAALTVDGKQKITEFFVAVHNLSSEQAAQSVEVKKQTCAETFKEMIAKIEDYEVLSMLVAGVICYFMPVPTANPLFSKMFTSAVASTTNYVLPGLITLGCRFFASQPKKMEVKQLTEIIDAQTPLTAAQVASP